MNNSSLHITSQTSENTLATLNTSLKETSGQQFSFNQSSKEKGLPRAFLNVNLSSMAKECDKKDEFQCTRAHTSKMMVSGRTS